MPSDLKIAIIGAGLAGCEAAWQLASRHIPVVLFEMRPEVTTPAHRTTLPAELVCSNSFKSRELDNAHGLLKAELEAAGSLIIKQAHNNGVPAGSALAVDRIAFSTAIARQLDQLKSFALQHIEIKTLESLRDEFEYVVVAGGPLLSAALTEYLQSLLQDKGLYFYDAIAPVVFADSIDMEIAYKASRYGKGEADYINCPLNKEQYGELIQNLLSAQKVPFREFERPKHFEGCLPIEVLAERSVEALSFGPLKPVGLLDPRDGKQPWAVLQLRQEDQQAALYNMVGCQTRMTWPEQKRVFRKIPGLEHCEFARYGSMHRNTYLNAPLHLNADLSLKRNDAIFLAGQLTGVEGYTESAAMGLWAAIGILMRLKKLPPMLPNPKTMIGALVHYLMTASPDNFQPMNANFGLLQSDGIPTIKDKKKRRSAQAEVALAIWKEQLQRTGLNPTGG